MVSVGKITNYAVTTGEKLVERIVNPHEILKLEHLEGAKYEDVLQGLKNQFPNLEFLQKHGIVKIKELPSGNKAVEIHTNRWRGPEEKPPVDAYQQLQLYFNKDGDCLQLTNIEGKYCGADYRGSVIRTDKGKQHLAKAGITDPKTYQRTDVTYSTNPQLRYRYQSNEHLPYGTANTLEYPNFRSEDCKTTKSWVHVQSVRDKDGKIQFIPYKIEPAE